MRTLPIALIFLLLASVGCRQEEKNVERDQAVLLYNRICSAALVYTDSISKAQDSTSVDSLRDRFEERLVEINYAAIPDTDYSLSEGENDTIKMRLDSLVAMHARRLRELGERKTLPVDSIDSLTSMQKVHLTSPAVKVKSESVAP